MSTKPHPLRRLQRLLAGTAAALGLIGPAVAQENIAATSGPFALQLVEKRSGLQFNANYGFVRVRYYEIRLLHRGKPLKLRKATGSSDSDFTDAFVLADAPEPALLVGNQGWQLVTERDGKPVVTALTDAAANGLRWAEGPASGRRIDVGRTRTEPPAALELEGRRRLMLDEKTVLDTATLQTIHPGRRQADAAAGGEAGPPPGYTLAMDEPLGTSPDGRAIAQLYRGASLSPRDALIIVSSLDGSGQTRLLPLDLQALTGRRDFLIDADALLAHFEWLPSSGKELPQLRPRAAADKSRQGWHSQFQFGIAAPLSPQGQRLPRYRVAPVRPALLGALREHLIDDCQATPAPAQAGDPPAEGFARLKLWIIPLLLRYDAAERSLLVEAAPGDDLLWAQQAVVCAGEAVESQMAEGGAWRQHLATPR